MHPRPPREGGTEWKRAGEVWRGVQPVNRETGANRVHAVDWSERGDTRARGGMHQTRTVGDRAQNLSKSLELGAVVRGVGIVGSREVREDAVDLEMRQRRDRSISRRRLVRRGAKPSEPRVDLEMDAGAPAKGGRGLTDGACALDLPDHEHELLSDGVGHFGRFGRTEQHEDRAVDAAFTEGKTLLD